MICPSPCFCTVESNRYPCSRTSRQDIIAGMTLPTYLLTWAPSSRTVEKVFEMLSAWAPSSSSVWNVLNAMAALAPQPSVVWMFPMAALIIAIVHVLITRRADMMVGAALLLFFYTAGHFLLPTTEVPSQEQLDLIVVLHTWFSCVASYILFVCVACSLIKHFIAMALGYRNARIERRESVLAKEKKVPVHKKKPVSKPRVPSASPSTLNKMSGSTKKVQVVRPDASF